MGGAAIQSATRKRAPDALGLPAGVCGTGLQPVKFVGRAVPAVLEGLFFDLRITQPFSANFALLRAPCAALRDGRDM